MPPKKKNPGRAQPPRTRRQATPTPTKKRQNEAGEEVKIAPADLVQLNPQPFESAYTIQEFLGEGAFGQVSRALHIPTQTLRAVKDIPKALMHDHDQASLFSELEILRQQDHPHILKVYEYFETETSYLLVTELLEGGDLFDYLVESEYLSEFVMASIMKQILQAVAYCHGQAIAHRDLKPENLMLAQRNENPSDPVNLKVIDFGLSRCKNPIILYGETGTVRYMAPQVVSDETYTEKCDIWSCGVILYLMIAGHHPFKGKTEEKTKREILKGEVAFDSEDWENISDDAKDLVLKMLAYTEEDRLSAQDCLQHPFISNIENHSKTNTYQYRGSLARLQSYVSFSRLQKSIMMFISSQILSRADTQRLSNIFEEIDVNQDGHLTKAELEQGYHRYFGGSKSRKTIQKEIRNILSSADLDQSDTVEFSEFITAACNRKRLLSKKNLEAAFTQMDTDQSGSLSSDEIKRILGPLIDEQSWAEIVAKVDKDFDGVIDLSEFMKMMLSTG